MMTNSKLSFCVSLALLSSVALVGCASGPSTHSAQLHQQIESATSTSEHTALASYYVQEAATARASAVDHRARALKYPASPGPRGSASMRAHCNSIAKSFDGVAAEYDGLAAEHRVLAGQSKS